MRTKILSITFRNTDISDNDPANSCWEVMARKSDFLIRKINEEMQHLNVAIYPYVTY